MIQFRSIVDLPSTVREVRVWLIAIEEMNHIGIPIEVSISSIDEDNEVIVASLTPTEASEDDDPMPAAVRQRR